MGVYVCKKCGKQYETRGFTDGLCDECSLEYQNKYQEVREFLWNNPGATANTVAKACDVSVRQVMQWVKEDRFMVSGDSKVSLYCEKCGTKIFSGKYCASCQASIEKQAQIDARKSRLQHDAENMHGTSMQKPGADDGKMRFLH